jgi:hypothetical protein
MARYNVKLFPQKLFIMKKISCFLTTVLFSATVLTAQQTHFGLKAGVNASSVDVTNGSDFKSKAGFNLGGLAHIHITRHFALQPEIVYSLQGGQEDNVKLNLHYFNIPLLAQYMTNDGFRLQTGPQLGFLASAKSKTGDAEISVKDDLSPVDFSWTFGAGYIFPSGLGIDARYNHGISNISDDESFEARNRVFQIGLFYQFMHRNASKRK